MDTAILVILLAMIDGNGELKRSLKEFLSFYRENRDLVAALSERKKPSSGTPSESEKESRPCEEAGGMNILEEYLKRAM